jgi:hypothetical protein
MSKPAFITGVVNIALNIACSWKQRIPIPAIKLSCHFLLLNELTRPAIAPYVGAADPIAAGASYQ